MLAFVLIFPDTRKKKFNAEAQRRGDAEKGI